MDKFKPRYLAAWIQDMWEVKKFYEDLGKRDATARNCEAEEVEIISFAVQCVCTDMIRDIEKVIAEYEGIFLEETKYYFKCGGNYQKVGSQFRISADTAKKRIDRTLFTIYHEMQLEKQGIEYPAYGSDFRKVMKNWIPVIVSFEEKQIKP